MRGAPFGVTAAAVVGAVVGAVCTVPGGAARAESGATLVAIVTTEPNASLTRRVGAELRGLGLDVIVLKPPDEASASRAPLDRAARGVGAVAAVRLVPSSEGKVEVWVADRVTGKAVVRELAAPESGASDAEVAVESVELLRASLMELHSGEPPHGDVPATDQIRSVALPTRASPGAPRIGLAAGAGVELGVRGLGPSVDGDISVWIRIGSRVGARVLGDASVTAARVSTSAGAVDVRSELVGAVATYSFVDAASAWVPDASMGLAASHVSTSGTATPPFVSAAQDAWSAAPLGGLGLAWSFAPGLRLRGDGLAAIALPAQHINAPTGSVGWWGAPTLILSFGFEMLWSSTP